MILSSLINHACLQYLGSVSQPVNIGGSDGFHEVRRLGGCDSAETSIVVNKEPPNFSHICFEGPHNSRKVLDLPVHSQDPSRRYAQSVHQQQFRRKVLFYLVPSDVVLLPYLTISVNFDSHHFYEITTSQNLVRSIFSLPTTTIPATFHPSHRPTIHTRQL